MFCTQCGNKCAEDSVFCTGCGARLHIITPAPVESEPEVVLQKEPEIPVQQEPDAFAVKEPEPFAPQQPEPYVSQEPEAFEPMEPEFFTPQQPEPYAPQEPEMFVTQETPVQPQVELGEGFLPLTQQVPDQDYNMYTPPKKKSKILPILIGVIGIALIAVLLIVLLGGNKPESVAEDFIVACFENDEDTVEEYFHKKMDRDPESWVYEDIEDFSMEIVGSREMLESGYERCGRSIGKKAKNIDSAYVVYFTCTFEDEDRDEKYAGYGQVEVFEYDGDWYVREREISVEEIDD